MCSVFYLLAGGARAWFDAMLCHIACAEEGWGTKILVLGRGSSKFCLEAWFGWHPVGELCPDHVFALVVLFGWEAAVVIRKSQSAGGGVCFDKG